MTIKRVNTQTAEIETINEPAPSFFSEVTDEMVRLEAARRMELLVSDYSREERETWPVQQVEAEAWKADNAASVPFIANLAVARGLSLADFVQVIDDKVAAYKVAVSAVLAAQTTFLAMPIADRPQDYTDNARWPA